MVKKKTKSIVIDEIILTLKNCLDQNYSEFNEKLYSVREGRNMGNPLNPFLAEIFMDYLENIIIKHPLSK